MMENEYDLNDYKVDAARVEDKQLLNGFLGKVSRRLLDVIFWINLLVYGI